MTAVKPKWISSWCRTLQQRVVLSVTHLKPVSSPASALRTKLSLPPREFKRPAIRKLVSPYLTTSSLYLRLKVNRMNTDALYSATFTEVLGVCTFINQHTNEQPHRWTRASPVLGEQEQRYTQPFPLTAIRASHPQLEISFCVILRLLCSEFTESTLCFTLHAAIKSLSIHTLTKPTHFFVKQFWCNFKLKRSR